MKRKPLKSGRGQRRLPDSRQAGLISGAISPLTAPSSSAVEADFINPSPEAIYLGNVPLRHYLEGCGLGHVIKLREYVFGSDLTPFLSAYSSLGRRAVHPGIAISLIMYGIMEGKWSLRSLEEMAVKEVCAWWLCGGVQPGHSTLGNFINRFSEVLTEDYFISLTKRLVEQLKLGWGAVAGEGTVVEAVSRRYKTIRKEAAAQALEQAKAIAGEHAGDQSAQSELARANGQKKSPAVCAGESSRSRTKVIVPRISRACWRTRLK